MRETKSVLRELNAQVAAHGHHNAPEDRSDAIKEFSEILCDTVIDGDWPHWVPEFIRASVRVSLAYRPEPIEFLPGGGLPLESSVYINGYDHSFIKSHEFDLKLIVCCSRQPEFCQFMKSMYGAKKSQYRLLPFKEALAQWFHAMAGCNNSMVAPAVLGNFPVNYGVFANAYGRMSSITRMAKAGNPDQCCLRMYTTDAYAPRSRARIELPGGGMTNFSGHYVASVANLAFSSARSHCLLVDPLVYEMMRHREQQVVMSPLYTQPEVLFNGVTFDSLAEMNIELSWAFTCLHRANASIKIR